MRDDGGALSHLLERIQGSIMTLAGPPRHDSAAAAGRLRRLAPLLALVLVTAASSACSSSPERPDPGPQPEQVTDPLDLEEPTPTELADSPCGNPDWSRLPDGSLPAPPAAAPVDSPGDPPGSPPADVE